MAALTIDRDTPYTYKERLTNTKVAATTKLFAGGIEMRNAAGFSVPGSDTAALVTVGRTEAQVDNSAGAAGDKSSDSAQGVFGYAGSAGLVALGEAARGTSVTCVDDQTVGLASETTNDIVVGVVQEVRGSVFYVAIGL